MYNRYQNITIEKASATGSMMYVNSIYPDIPVSDNDNYIVTTLGDRLDILSQTYYGDADFWWIIASANALPGDSLFPIPGTQLRLPKNILPIINSYKQINAVR
jgi:hypothetical protein